MTTNYLRICRVEWLFSVAGSKECDLNFSGLSILKDWEDYPVSTPFVGESGLTWYIFLDNILWVCMIPCEAYRIPTEAR